MSPHNDNGPKQFSQSEETTSILVGCIICLFVLRQGLTMSLSLSWDSLDTQGLALPAETGIEGMDHYTKL